jgi:hypothetical protein
MSGIACAASVKAGKAWMRSPMDEVLMMSTFINLPKLA